jgi:DNA-nicking Smr family endonuclease
VKKKERAARGKGVTKKAPDAGFRPFGALKTLRDELSAKDAQAVTAKHPAPPPPKPSATWSPAEDDEAVTLFRMMSGVTPLAGKAKRLPKTQSTLAPSELEARRAAAEAPIRTEDDEVHARLRALVEGSGRFEVTDDGRRVEGRRHDVTPDIARRLRRGMFPIDARVDLHGETASTAPKVLEKFLREQRAKGERCVLVVHGKGEHSPRGVGILRGEIAAWLSQGAGSVHVAAFATARDDDGGEGAVYVLLTR